jgi:hypothetical protein
MENLLSEHWKTNNKNLFCDFIFFHLAAENSARWHYHPARGMIFLMAILVAGG